MKRLTGTDALFLSMETPAWHQHVGGVIILDPRDAPDFGGFEAVRAVVDTRLTRIPKYRWKVREVPLQLDRPVWVEDATFDLDRHVHRVEVRAPGGRRELGDLIGELMGRRLDRRIPLWELWYVDGVANGKVAIIAKYHHCMMDGVAGASLAAALFDLEPNPPPRPEPADTMDASGERDQRNGHDARDPSGLELLARGLVPALATPVRAAGYSLGLARRALTMVSYRARPDAPPVIAPSTPFNGAVGGRRRMAFASVSLPDVRRVKDALDVKVNDVALALCAGALRAYLASVDALPDRPLVVAVPVSTAGPDERDSTNQVANMWATLPTDEDEPVARVRAIQRSTRAAKEQTAALRSHPITSMGGVAPPFLLDIASYAVWASHVAAFCPVAGGNLIVSNVPGPPFALYACGAKVAGIFSASVLAFNIGMNITLMSYEDRIDFGVVVDPDLMHDPWLVADRLPDALRELMLAAGLGEPTPVADAFAP